MAHRKDKELIYTLIKKYVNVMKEHNIPVWRLYLYGSYTKGAYHKYSDIDLAIFWDQDEIDGFDEDVFLMKLTRRVDLRLEPRSFAKTDFDETNPYIKEIIETGVRII